MNKEEWEDIIILDWMKSLDKEIIAEIKELTSIKRFKAGTILSNKEIIQSEVFFILDGNARLTYNYNFDFYTIKKLKKNDWVGLISYLRNSPIEQVISITDITLLCIPDALIITPPATDEQVQARPCGAGGHQRLPQDERGLQGVPRSEQDGVAMGVAPGRRTL